MSVDYSEMWVRSMVDSMDCRRVGWMDAYLGLMMVVKEAVYWDMMMVDYSVTLLALQ